MRFRLTGWCAWSVEYDTPEKWLRWADVGKGRPAAPGYPPATAPPMMRRRATALGQKGLSAALGMPEVDTARLVLASRHGEFARTLAILDTLARREQPSPTEFSMSVHNALLGLISIARKNTRGHTALSAGPDSFCCGMLEAAAAALRLPDDPVILLYLDDMPGNGFSGLVREKQGVSPFVLALGISVHEDPHADAICMRRSAVLPDGDGAVDDQALAFFRFALAGGSGAAAAGRGGTWEWRRD